MDANGIFVVSVFGIFAIYFLSIGILIRIGKLRAWFWLKGYPVIAPKSFFFAFIPVGIAFLTAAIAASLPEPKMRGDVFVFVAMPTCFVGIILAIWQPSWLLPVWYRWLLNEHGHILHFLEAEARKMGKWEWQERINTQAGLEAWVAEVKDKYGL